MSQLEELEPILSELLEVINGLEQVKNDLPRSVLKTRRYEQWKLISHEVFSLIHVLDTTTASDNIQEAVKELANGVINSLTMMQTSYKDMACFIEMQNKCKSFLPYNKYNTANLRTGGAEANLFARIHKKDKHKPVVIWFCDPSGELHEGTLDLIKLANYTPVFVIRYYSKVTRQALVIPTSFLTHASRTLK